MAVAAFQTAIAISVSRETRVTFALYGMGSASAVFVTHFLRHLIHKWGWVELHPVPLLPRILGVSFVGGVINTCIVAILALPIVGVKDAIDSVRFWLGPAIGNWSSLIFIWMLAYFGIHYFERFLKLELQAKNAQMRSLEAQLNPHFLFNCLNGLRGLIGEDPARARQMVTELSELLRYSLRPLSTSTVPLAEEMQAVDAFLRLEKMRFEERLKIDMDIDDDTLLLPVPPMMLQTLVENAIKHGISKNVMGGFVRVASDFVDGHHELVVQNSGQLNGVVNGTGFGIKSTQDRLNLLYQGKATFDIKNLNDEIVESRIIMPV